MPPFNGGQLRCYHLLKGVLHNLHDVHLVIGQKIEELKALEAHDNLNIHSTFKFKYPGSGLKGVFGKLFNAFFYRWHLKTIKGPANIFFIETFDLVKKVVKKNRFDFVIYEHLESMKFAKVIKKYNKNTIHILDAHNVDYILYKLQLENGEDTNPKIIKTTYWYESHLSRFVDSVWVCSEHDKNTFQEINKKQIKIEVVPNGTDVERKPFDNTTSKYKNKHILFVGDLSTRANKDGILWFYDHVWPLLKPQGLKLNVVGRGGNLNEFRKMKYDSSIFFKGMVNDLQKEYYNSSIAIVPLRLGSGTRLKILESMSFGNPVVSTTIGAEGLNMEDGKEILIANKPEQFANAINKLITTKDLFEDLRLHARKRVEQHYDWQIITENINNSLHKLS